MNAQTKPGLAPAPALLLGAGGLVPFVCLPVLDALHPASELLLQALATYAAVILSFVGALHWGYAVQSNSQGRMGPTAIRVECAAGASRLACAAVALSPNAADTSADFYCVLRG